MDHARYFGLESLKFLLTGDGFEGLTSQPEYILKGKEYLALSRQQKAEIIWDKVLEDPEPGQWHAEERFSHKWQNGIEMEGDEFDCFLYANCVHKRAVHAIGNVGKVIWKDLGGHPYTGMFKGGDTGFVRFSTAEPPDIITPRMCPAMGAKFLRDGMDSGNMLAQHNSPTGFYQKSLNFFENDWSNATPLP